jgi:hypothetical protein
MGDPWAEGAVQVITTLLLLIVVVGLFGMAGTVAQSRESTAESLL